MSADFHASPVPIRMTCRYANGIVVSYGARALGYDDSSLRVLSSETFEKGVNLNVLAPFLEGIASCRVAAITRSQEQRSYFEIELRFLKKPVPARREARETIEGRTAVVPEELLEAARELAVQLEQYSGKQFSRVWQEFPPARRPLFLMVTAAAVLLLLQEKGFSDVRHLLVEVKERATR